MPGRLLVQKFDVIFVSVLPRLQLHLIRLDTVVHLNRVVLEETFVFTRREFTQEPSEARKKGKWETTVRGVDVDIHSTSEVEAPVVMTLI